MSSDHTGTIGELIRKPAVVLLVPALLAAGLVGVRLASTDDGAEPARAEAADDVRTVESTDRMTGSSQPPAGGFGIVRSGDRLEVTGTVPDAAAKPIVLAAAKAKAGLATVVDKLTIDPAGGAPDPAWVSGLAATAVSTKGETSVSYDGRTITISGRAPDEAAKAAVGRAAAAAVPGAKVANNQYVR